MGNQTLGRFIVINQILNEFDYDEIVAIAVCETRKEAEEALNKAEAHRNKINKLADDIWQTRNNKIGELGRYNPYHGPEKDLAEQWTKEAQFERAELYRLNPILGGKYVILKLP